MSDLISRSKAKEQIMDWAVNILNPKTLGTEDTMHVLDTMQAVSDEEFKAEAKRRGYNVIKIPEKVKLLPCVCGRRRLVLWWGNHGESYACPICGSEGESGKNNRQARLNWNMMIEEKMKDAGKENG